jgi:hypothetical protein
MPTNQVNAGRTEAAIIARMIHPEKGDLPGAAAQALLRLTLDQTDLDRMHELAVKNREDALTAADKTELETYLRISYFVDLMHAKGPLFPQQENEASVRPRHERRARTAGEAASRAPVRILPPAGSRVAGALRV